MTDPVLDRLRDALADDWVYFAELVSIVRDVHGTASIDELLRRAGAEAERLVRQAAVIAGTLTVDGFTPWSTTPTESAERIRRDVEAMIRDGASPAPGDVCWFDLPGQ